MVARKTPIRLDMVVAESYKAAPAAENEIRIVNIYCGRYLYLRHIPTSRCIHG